MPISIKAARVNAGLTQDAVGEALGTSKTTYANYENYRTSPPITTAEKIAALFGLNVNDIKWSNE